MRNNYFPGRVTSKWSGRDCSQQPILATSAIKSVEVIATNGTFNILSCPPCLPHKSDRDQPPNVGFSRKYLGGNETRARGPDLREHTYTHNTHILWCRTQSCRGTMSFTSARDYVCRCVHLPQWGDRSGQAPARVGTTMGNHSPSPDNVPHNLYIPALSFSVRTYLHLCTSTSVRVCVSVRRLSCL